MTSRVLGVALATALVSVACFSEKPKPNTPPVPVAVTRATQRDVPYNLTADGVVEPMQTAQVQAQVGGILTKVAFKEGDEVQEGQVLFELDPRPFKALLDQAEANLGRDQATYANAKAEADRYQSLVQKDYVTKEQFDQEVANAGAAAATVKSDTATIEQARINLEWATIRAPISGKAGQLLVRQGNLVRAGTQQPLVLINQIQPILVHFALPATALPAIMQYAAKDTLPVTVVPGMPPNSTAQPTSTGPTPAYTTDPIADDPSTETVGVGTGDDPATPSGQPGAGGGRRARTSAGGPPSGPPTGTGAAADPAASADPAPAGPGVAPAGGAGRRRSGGAAAGDSGAQAPGAAVAKRRPATMPGLPGVPSPSPSKGTLSLIDNQVDTTTSTVLLKAKFLNAGRTLWPGQFVATTLRLFVEKNALVVPAQAVMTGQQGTYVYLVDQTGVARLRSVTVERTAGNAAVIEAGLVVGDEVVTDGQSRLSPGSKVNIRGLVPAGSGGQSAAPSSSPG